MFARSPAEMPGPASVIRTSASSSPGSSIWIATPRGRRAVAKGVVDQIPEQDGEKTRVSEYQHVRFTGQLDVHPLCERGGCQIADRALQHGRELQWGRLERHGIRSQAGERQHLLDGVCSAIASGDHAIQRVRSLSVAGRSQRDLRLGTDASERRPELVCRVGSEPAFLFDQPVHALEELIEARHQCADLGRRIGYIERRQIVCGPRRHDALNLC
jgi:hypothetical protein